jgi:hypothetical protein
MINVLLNNSWVIGIGTTVIAAVIIGVIRYYFFSIGEEKRGKNVSSINHDSPHITAEGSMIAGRDIVVGGEKKTVVEERKSVSNDHTQVTPEQIFEYLDGLPPLQRDSASRNYQGIKVSWLVKFGNAVSHNNGQLLLIMRYSYNFMSIGVTCMISVRSYPKLKIIKEDHEFLIEGTIEFIDSAARRINLKNCKLSL